MNIIVCVKQVPGSNDIKVDEKTGVLVRPKEGNKLNPYDLFALEEAFRLKDEDEYVSICAVSMGPPQTEEVLDECVWMGCDEGVLVTDRAFGGADVLATSYTLSQAIKKVGVPSAIFCGKQTTDGDTAQVGAELAEHLGIPHLSNVNRVVAFTDDHVIVEAIQDNLVLKEKIALPCLLCFDSDINTPRLPSYKRKKTMECHIRRFSINDFEDQDQNHYGLKGSPTRVRRIFPPDKNKQRSKFEGESSELAIRLKNLLSGKKFIINEDDYGTYNT